MSYNDQNNCNVGMQNTVYHFYAVYDARNIFNPANTITAGMSIIKLEESANSVYAYCDFGHLNLIIQKLTTFNLDAVLEGYGQLLSRIIGMLFDELWDDILCIQEGNRSGNNEDIGYCTGRICMFVLDTKF
eukprot:CAMPEP_0170543524 /NCGR_PEP_ID=MMETSP0211-20121228/2614_1 /TAXON_ID=311385 /ORGANISM="Pseudokeronopsis sp., Strain OXSARD2" /LENGTH=130 /DNA_ID=CAMNT_0010846925 /DNA_START=194 /DNA_END=586 /DNA_ORIENTATION=-